MGDLVQLQILGPFAIRHNGRTLDLSRLRRRPGSLLRLLAVSPNRSLVRDQVIDLLWPDSMPEAGGSNLRYVLHQLRHALPDISAPVVSDAARVTLNQAYRWETDLDRFMDLACVAGDDVAVLEEAAAFFRGEPLPDDRYEDWAAPVRERTERTYREVCMRLAGLQRAPRDAARWYETLLQHDPLDEEAFRGLLRTLRDIGARTEALRRFGQFEQLLRDQLDAPPEEETLALVAEIRALGDKPELPSVREEVEHTTALREVVPTYPLLPLGSSVGRDVELNEIVAAFPDGVAERPAGPSPTPRLLLLSAEAGMGKTRLLGEAARRARQAEMMVLAGGCYEQEGKLPYGPIHDALLDFVRAQTPDILAALLGGLLPELGRILPELHTEPAARPEAMAGAGESQRLQLFSAVAKVCARIAEQQPLLLLLDDLHWADEGTLQLMHFLVRQPDLERVLLLGAYRNEEVAADSTLAGLIASTQRGHRARVVPLAPIREDDLRALIEEQLGGRCAAETANTLHERSGGNPFFALQMLQLLQQSDLLQPSDSGWQIPAGTTIELPEAVREVVARRLRLLTDLDRQTLALGAILGRTFSYRALESLWRGETEPLFAALDRALDAQLLQETEEGYAFRHPLLREVVYERTPRHRRIQLHGRAGDVLRHLYGEAAPEHAAELAYQFVGAGPERREDAIAYLIEAGDQAEKMYAHQEAEGYFRAALQTLHDAGDRSRKADVLRRLGTVLATLARYDEALAALEPAAEGFERAGDLERVGQVAYQIGDIHGRRGTPGEGIRRIQPLLDTFERHRGPLLAALHTALAWLYFSNGQYAECRDSAEQGSQVAREIGDDLRFADAELWRGTFLRAEESRRVTERALEILNTSGDQHLLRLALGLLAGTYTALGEFRRALRCQERLLDIVEQTGDPTATVYALARFAITLWLLGEWPEARRFCRQAIDTANSSGSSWFDSQPPLTLGQLCLAEGRWEEAAQYIEQAMSAAERGSSRQQVRLGQVLLAERDLDMGRPEAALHRLQNIASALEEEAQPGRVPLLLQSWGHLAVLASVHLAMGNTRQAAQTLRLALPRARAHDHKLFLAPLLRVQGMLHTHQRHWEEAERAFAEAIALTRAMPYPYEEARSRHEFGMTLLAQGDHERARQELLEALATFNRLGARHLAEQADAALRHGTS